MKKILILSLLILVILCVGMGHLVIHQSQNKPTVLMPDNYRLSINQQTKLSNLEPKTKSETADLDVDGKPEQYVFENNQLSVHQNDEVIWQSNEDWRVDDFALADSTNDGVVDLNLSVWKSGSFGTSQPFWIEENDPSVKNHFFVLDLVDGKIKPIWQSSNLNVPNCELVIADIDGDAKNELTVIEGEYSSQEKCEGKYVAVWKWSEWGFFNQWRSEKSNFANLKTEIFDNQTWVTANEF